jgi:DNA-binding response OmpR family regulator
MEVDDRAAIMVVGDNADFSYLIGRYVGQASHRAVCAYPEMDVVTLARRVRPIAIVLEADPPGSRCWQVLRALKAETGTCDIPVLLCSWLDDEAHGLDEGADVYLRKPVLYEDLLAALADVGVYPRS